ncbi:E3 ubiquitin-protein ligase TRIM7-like [Heteronotia binoei]|uniref:E3 ubiquitin-protein ligase TRIM7-like n=1 Tax=Heteronotia binoei TaxID=13085 RepID=UPI002930B8C4|nr:E3 ubiquitin-protein ligase TRIM7-like [Heteronotia binoei]
MAEGALQELCEEATCSICLELFSDPLILPECGHNFCRACLSQSWGGEPTGAALAEPGAAVAEPSSCPQCRARVRQGCLRPNLQLANLVEILKKFGSREGREGEGGACQKHGKPLKFFCKEDDAPVCMVCGLSKEHKGHQVVPLEEAFWESRATVAAQKGRICQKHQEPMKLFCKDDEALICVVCDRSKEHRDHKTLPLEEASQEYKDQFCSCLEILKKKRKKIVACKEDLQKESQDLLKQTTGEKQKTASKFRQLHTFLEEQERLLLAQMEEVEKEVARKKDQQLGRLAEELSSLENLIREMEEKCQQPASDFLQDVHSTLQRHEEEEFENPLTFPLALKWRIWDFCDINHLLEGLMKQLKDNLDSGLYLQKANVTLDPDTAQPYLILSKDQKSVRQGKTPQALPNNPERFDRWYIVLGREGFTAGRHFWEVLVGNEGRWLVGMAKKSVNRKGSITFSPEEGFWKVGKWNGDYRAVIKDLYPPLTLTGELKRIRVCLNHTGGRVAFFDADRAALIYEFSGASFSGETLLPSFWVCLEGHLQLC